MVAMSLCNTHHVTCNVCYQCDCYRQRGWDFSWQVGQFVPPRRRRDVIGIESALEAQHSYREEINVLRCQGASPDVCQPKQKMV